MFLAYKNNKKKRKKCIVCESEKGYIIFLFIITDYNQYFILYWC